MRGLKGKRAIVSGGGAGIGRAIVEAFCREGVQVTFSGLDAAEIETERAIQSSLGGAVKFVHGDMSDPAFCQELTDSAVRRWGGVDFLVNNAFSFIAKGADATREDWTRMMNVGPIAYATMAQCVLDPMKKSGGGAIVNVSSVSAHVAQPNRWTYNAAKGAVNQLTRCMALDLAPFNIRVNTISPGWIWTREVDKAANFDRGKWGPVWGKFHMMRRLGEVHEVASATMFLCSDEASFITAAELPVDGGYLGMGSEGPGDASSFAGSK